MTTIRGGAVRRFDPELQSSGRSEASLSDEWGTPQDLFDRLNARWHFDIDLAASEDNHKCARCYTKDDDALSKTWNDFRAGFQNIPYSRGQPMAWMTKARNSVIEFGNTVVSIVPVRTSEKWWHSQVMAPAGALYGVTRPAENVIVSHYELMTVEIEFIKGRVAFVGPSGKKNPARFASAVVAFVGGSR